METLSTEYRILGSIPYLIWPLSLIIVSTTFKKDRFLRFHGYQALYLGIMGSVLWLVGGALLRIIPFFGIFLFNCLAVFWFLFLLLLTYRCYQGEYFRVPLVYDLAQRNME
jgi:Predicted membrane protein